LGDGDCFCDIEFGRAKVDPNDIMTRQRQVPSLIQGTGVADVSEQAEAPRAVRAYQTDHTIQIKAMPPTEKSLTREVTRNNETKLAIQWIHITFVMQFHQNIFQIHDMLVA
jgi:hypothetical protein